MGYIVDNAVIMAAGIASRFAPLSYEIPKALIEVRGEVLIERQIRQLRESGIDHIIIVVGYMKENFAYLTGKFGVKLVENKEYLTRNNNGSIFAVRDYLKNTYICSSDNFFIENPFELEVDDSYYASVFANGLTKEWCLTEDEQGYINSITIGGSNKWYMLGHAFWNENFSRRFIEILEDVYYYPETTDMLWEKIYMQHLNELKMKIKRYPDGSIFEFDTLDELRVFDESYIDDTRSKIIKDICRKHQWQERNISNIVSIKKEKNTSAGFDFIYEDKNFEYNYITEELKRLS